MRILVTGWTGFIGSYFCTRLVQDGIQVIGLSSSKGSWRTPLIPRVEAVTCDLRNATDLSEIITRTRPDIVYHLATYGVDHRQKEDEKRILETNILGTYNLLKVCHSLKIPKTLIAGSVYEYGSSPEKLTESLAPNPFDMYGASKVASTGLALAFRNKHALDVSVLRLFNVYGPFETPNRLIPSAIMASMNGMPFSTRNPKEKRDFVFIDDVYQAFRKASTAGVVPDVYNVGSGNETSISDLLLTLREELGGNLIIKSGPSGSIAEPTFSRCVSENKKLETATGFRADYTLARGLRTTIEWFRLHSESYREAA